MAASLHEHYLLVLLLLLLLLRIACDVRGRVQEGHMWGSSGGQLEARGEARLLLILMRRRKANEASRSTWKSKVGMGKRLADGPVRV